MSKLDVRTPDSEKKADDQYAPVARKLNSQENESIPGYDRDSDGLDDRPIDSDDSSGSKYDSNVNKNIKSTKEKEEDGGGWKNNVTSDGGGPKPNLNTRIKGIAKKKGPLGLIIGLLFGGGAGMTLLFSPGIAIVQLKEIISGDLNDQLGAMSIFDEKLMNAKLKDIGSGVCTSKVTIRCKFSTMSKKEIEGFKKAGFKVEPDTPNKIFGRTKITKLTFPDGKVITNPAELKVHINGSLPARAALLRAFNPKFAGLADKASAGVFARFKTNKAEKVNGTTEEDQEKSVSAATAGDDVNIDAKPFQTDSEGREYVVNEQGQSVYKELPDGDTLPEGAIVDPDSFQSILDINQKGIGDIGVKATDVKTSGVKATSGVLKGGLKGLNIAGALDTACSVWNTARAVSAAAKATRAIQLAQYAMVFFNVADRIKAGTATPEEVTYAGNKLTSIDTNKQMASDDNPDKTVDNPYYGASAYDSPGYKTAAYNEAPLLQPRDTQYIIGGALVGKLSDVLDTIGDVLGGKKNIRSKCKVVQSWWARSAGLIAGLVSAVGSFGVSTALSIGASVAIGFAMPYLEAALADIIAGKVVDGKTEGVDAGDAVFSGGAALLGGMAAAHGMMPANKKGMKAYLSATADINQKNIAAETYDAQQTPLDINNQYSFLGAAVRTINPVLTKSTASLSGAITNIPSLLGVAASSIFPKANAEPGFNDDRYSKCTDSGYEDLDIDADVFCNVRYYMSPEQLALEPDETVTWMTDHGHIDDDGAPISDAYTDWIKNCTEREDGWGETSNDDDNSDGAIGLSCVTKDKNAEQLEQLKYFGAFYMTYQLQETKDSGYLTGASAGGGNSSGPQTSAATPEMCKTMGADDLGQIACKAYQFDNYGYLWAGGHSGTAAGFMKDFKAGKYKAGSDQILDCSGMERMAIFDATGVDIGGLSTSGFASSKHLTEISKSEAKAGDLLWKPGHTEIIVSNNTSAKTYETFGAHTANTEFPKQIGPSHYGYDRVSKVYRFTK